MGKVDDNKRLKLNSMLDAALQLFTDQGLVKTSISDIVNRSGVAKGTFYLYFKDKYDIRNKLVAHESRKLLRNAYIAMQEAQPKGLEDQMLFITEHLLAELTARRPLLVLISKNLSWGVLKQEIIRPDAEEEFEFLPVLHSLTAPYGLTTQESEIMLYLLVELVGASCFSATLYQEPCDLETLKPYLYQAVRAIIRQFTDAHNIPASDA